MDNTRWPGRSVLPVAVPGIKFIVPAILITGLFFLFGWQPGAIVGMGISLFFCWFFRDPKRNIPNDPDCLVAPADGRVIVVKSGIESEYFEAPCHKISIFMNVFNVHVNRIPCDGEIEKVTYSPGKFFNASFDKASADNERNAVTIRTPAKDYLVVVQIAGLVARRIVCCVTPGQPVSRGERYGMIQFGSRLDIYLPMRYVISVREGDHTTAGVTVIGKQP